MKNNGYKIDNKKYMIKSLHKKEWFKLALLLIMAGIIFFLSSQPGEASSRVSGFFSVKVKYVLEKVLKIDVPGMVEQGFAGIDHYVRKFGHFFEYFLLGLLAANYFLCRFRSVNKAVQGAGFPGGKVNKGLKAKVFSIAFVFCAAYAASDEFHQRFVPARGPSVKDVLLDSFAACVAVIVFLLNTNIKEEHRGQN